MGEFGASTFQYSTDANKLQDLNAKAEWDRAIVQKANARGFSWFYWEFCANEFGAYDKETKTWHDVILKALLETP
jgi:endoglucanase